MQKTKINHLIIKNIGFLNYDKNFRSKVEKDSTQLLFHATLKTK